MRRPPTAGRRDANEWLIVDAARRCGFKVFYLSELGDLLVQIAGKSDLWEVKSNPKATLTDLQYKLRQQGLKVRRVETVDDVLAARREMI